MMPTLINYTTCFLVAGIDYFVSTYAVAAYVFALLVKNGVDPAICFVQVFSPSAIGALLEH